MIIQLRRGVDAAQGRALVRALGGKPGVDLRIINGLSARLSAAAARRLAANPIVHAVSLNAAIRDTALTNPTPWTLATPFDQIIGATKLWSRSTGAGIGVAVIDTGVSGDLPDFETTQYSAISRVIASAVVDPGASTADDTYGHGTAVAGLVAGNGWYCDSYDPLYGEYAGTAPDANLISVKVADDSGHATTLDAIYGLQFAVDHKADYNIRVVNLSFRSTSGESYTTDPLDAAVEQAWFHGITVVAAAGNLGTADDAVSYAPGNDPYVITVGGVDTRGRLYLGRRPGQLVEPRRDAGRFRETRRGRAGRPHRLDPGARKLVRVRLPDLRDRRSVLPAQRHVAGRADGGRGRGGSARGTSPLDARDGQGRDRQHGGPRCPTAATRCAR